MVPQTMPRVMVTGGLLVSSRGEATSSICHMSSRGDSTLSPAAAASAASASASACGLVLAAAPCSVAIGEGCSSSSPATFFLRGIWLAPGARRPRRPRSGSLPSPVLGRSRRCDAAPTAVLGATVSRKSCSVLVSSARSGVAPAPAFP